MPSENHRQTLRLQKLGRFLSLLLKHRSARFPIQLDAQGYATIKDVMHILNRLPNFRWAHIADVKAVLDLPGPQRFEITGDQGRDTRIRAYQKHSSAEPKLEPVTPPDVLIYGAAPEILDEIRQDGIRPADDAYVQLAADLATARSIAVRKTPDPLILHINAAAAHASGHQFTNPKPGIYLTEAIPPEFIEEIENT